MHISLFPFRSRSFLFFYSRARATHFCLLYRRRLMRPSFSQRIRYTFFTVCCKCRALYSKLINIHAMQCGDAARRREESRRKTTTTTMTMSDEKHKKTVTGERRFLSFRSLCFFFLFLVCLLAFCFFLRLMRCHLSHCCSRRSHCLAVLLVGGHVEWLHNASIIIIQIFVQI